MLLPVVAIVGRPNVGKSTLFNRLTQTRDAVVSAFPGTTRDRLYGEVKQDDRQFIIIDTGGMTEGPDEIGSLITQQATQAIADSDNVIFVIDAKDGITPEDYLIAKKLRRTGKPVHLAVNKTEGQDPTLSVTEAYELGLGTPVPIAAAHGTGIASLLLALFPQPNKPELQAEDDEDLKRIRLAIVGRPNVGKSTLTNRLLDEDKGHAQKGPRSSPKNPDMPVPRVIVHDSPGTTRDSIFVPLTRQERDYTLIDTAGVRKRNKVTEVPEKFSVVKTLQAIENAHVVLYVIDARLGASEQDLKLLGFVLECGRGLVIAVNKWDGLSKEMRDRTKATLDRHLDFVRFAHVHYISALYGSGIDNVFESVNEAYDSATKKLATPELNQLLQQAQATHQPPLVHGRRVKLRYAHPGGHNPQRIIIHGNQLHALPESYRKFLAHFFQEKLNLSGVPVLIEFKTSDNPFKKRR